MRAFVITILTCGFVLGFVAGALVWEFIDTWVVCR
jgi:hypothetical protein